MSAQTRSENEARSPRTVLRGAPRASVPRSERGPQAALFDLAKIALSDAGMEHLAREAVETIALVLGSDFAHVMRFLPDEGALVLSSSFGFGAGLEGSMRVPVGSSARLGYVSQASYTMIAGEPVVVEDFDREPRLEGCELLKAHAVKSGVTVCVSPENEKPYGIVGAHWREPREITHEEKGCLEDVAGVLADAQYLRLAGSPSAPGAALATELQAAIERGDLAESRHEALRAAMALLAAAGGPKNALEAAASTLIARGADWACVDLLEDDGKPGYTHGDKIHRAVVRRAKPAPSEADPEVEAAADRLALQIASHYPLDPEAPVGTPKVLRTRRPHLCARLTREHLKNVANDAHHAGLIERVQPTSCAAAPIWLRGRVAGALIAVSTHGRLLDERFLDTVEELADCATLALSNGLAGLSFEEEREEIVGIVSDGPDVASARKEEPRGTRAQTGAARGPDSILTPMQKNVLSLCARRLTQKEIARELRITVSTVKDHITHASRRLGVKGGWRPVHDEAVRQGELQAPEAPSEVRPEARRP
jgi:GAF domain-containing protein/DNA-binding CsgD family transcriptional regulator